MKLSRAEQDVLAERRRHVSEEGWMPEHDDQHRYGEMALAAAAYTLSAVCFIDGIKPPVMWPWSRKWWKPKSNRRDLVRAGSLIIAEIERIDRQQEAGDEADK